MVTLSQLHFDIENRVQSIRENQPDWLCGKGCDNCCRRLARVPQLTEAEWVFLQEGLAALAPEHLQSIRREITILANNPTSPVVCPLLDRTTGACPVYAHRPVACRTYGFFVQRDNGLYCQDIEAKVADGALPEVVWGNHDAIDRSLLDFGETRGLTEWFER